MKRRDFLATVGAAGVAVVVPRSVLAAPAADYGNLLILVELKGGNDGLNTVVPYAAAEYYSLRPRLAIPREQVLQLDSTTGLHPSLQPLMPIWESRELAVVQGIGYPNANLSHFRSIEIWDTASSSNEYLREGWLARTFAQAPAPAAYAADGIVVGGGEFGPLAGRGHPGDRAREHRAVSAAGAACGSLGGGAQRTAAAHPQSRVRHHSGRRQHDRGLRVPN